MKIKKRMTARRYAEHIRKARAALDTYNFLARNNYQLPECIRLFNPADFLINAIDSSLSAIEAFVNHLGYIFSDDWDYFKGKNFWLQYKYVIKILTNMGVDVGSYKKEPILNFDKYRKKYRNPFHHVHTSQHDIKVVEKNYIDNIEADLQESMDMINCWVDPRVEDATDIFEKSQSFIIYFQNEFKKKLFQGCDIAEILKRDRRVKLENDSERDALLRRFINDPLNALPLVSGNYVMSL